MQRRQGRFGTGNVSSRDLGQLPACSKTARPAAPHIPSRVLVGHRSFEQNVAGEWEGASATFSQQGSPLQLPDSLVPQALREWDMVPYDWQTQVNMRGIEGGIEYTVMRLSPTTGCEADAIAQKEAAVKLSRSTDAASMRIVSNDNGSYTACSPALAAGARAEHCFLTDAHERIRVVQQLSSLEDGWVAKTIEVHHERRAGEPLEHGRMLDLRENVSTFAETPRLDASSVPEDWKVEGGACGFFAGQDAAPVCSSRIPARWPKRDRSKLLGLPLGLWSCVCGNKKQLECEAGILLQDGRIGASVATFESGSLCSATNCHGSS
ncbi:hypothetical protein WJX74_008310 [Apatococcus lobatus]|uniref:Uncharacterized protein n=1 Tax=Apatococcus lobatus TaxID=904363 RepID=A0AAW1Q6Q0_9CHLO